MSWPVIFAIGLATYCLRASFVMMGNGRTLDRVERHLRFVPVAVLPALAASAVVGSGGEGLDLRVAAAAAAAGIAWRTHSISAAMVTGMTVLWLLQAWSM